MNRSVPALAAAALVVIITAVSSPRAATASDQSGRVARGKYLVTIGGCNDCHTPLKMTPTGPAPDTSRMLSGHPEQLEMPPGPAMSDPWGIAMGSTLTAFSGPWGTSFARNLTPDKETGLGAWSEKDFVDTIRNGKHLGRGRPLLPPMPWFNYAEATDEDLRSIFAYLRSIPAVKNRVEEPRPPGA